MTLAELIRAFRGEIKDTIRPYLVSDDDARAQARLYEGLLEAHAAALLSAVRRCANRICCDRIRLRTSLVGGAGVVLAKSDRGHAPVMSL